MIVPRRDFLKLLGVAAGAAGIGGCARQWAVPDRLVEMALRGPGLEGEVQTVCGLCETGCGLTVRRVDGVPVGLKGNPNHPLNRGGLCPVGHAGLEVLYSPNRLRQPLRRGPAGELVSAAWDDVLGEIAARLAELRAAGSGGRVAVLHGEPGFLFDDLARAFAHVMGSTDVIDLGVPGAVPYRLAQGIDETPAYHLEEADLVLSFGLDVYEDGPAPLRAIAAMVGSRPTERRAGTIHVGTRLSPSAAKAEEWVPVRPGTHAAFALGVAHVLVREGRYDRDFVAEHTFGFEDWTDERGHRHGGFRRLLLERYYPDRAAQLCGVDAASVVRVARRFAEVPSSVAIAGGEATEGTNATWTTLAVQALNALVGAFDRPGGVTLAAAIPVMPLGGPEGSGPEPGGPVAAAPVASAWPALKDEASTHPLEALAGRALEGADSVEVLLVVSADPVHDSPVGADLRAAMQRIPTVVALASFENDTTACADFVLPTHVFLERWQATTTPATVAFATVGVARPVVEPLYDTRHPGDVLIELAGRAAAQEGSVLPWDSYSEYLQRRLEGLAVSGQGAIVSGSFEETWIHFLEERGWRFQQRREPGDYWDELLRQGGWWDPSRSPGDWGRMFRTASGRYEFYSRRLERLLRDLGEAAAAVGANDGANGARGGASVGPEDGSNDAGSDRADDAALARGIEALGLEADPDEVCLPHYEAPRFVGDGDLVLHSFRPITARGSLGATSPMVLEMFGHSVMTGWQTWAELAPETAAELGVADGDFVAVESDRASIEAVVRVQPGSVPGVVHVPVGLGHPPSYGAGRGAGANVAEVIVGARDTVAGTVVPGATRVHVRLLRRRARGGPPPWLGEGSE